MKLATIVLLSSLGSLKAHAQAPPVTWQGHFTSNGELHRMVLQADQAADGSWTLRSLAVDFLPDAIHLDSASFLNGHVAASTNIGKGAYDAQLNPDGISMTGTWTWDKQPVEVELKRVPNEAAWHTPMNYQYHHKGITYARSSPNEPRIPFTPRLAVDYMDQGALAWTKERGCISCHSNGTYMMVRPLMSGDLGAPQQAMHDFWVSELKTALAADAKQRNGKFDGTEAVYLAAGLAIWDAHVSHHLSPETVQALNLMFQFQRPAGDWYIEDDVNPPSNPALTKFRP